jgi:hypothetical protein
LVLGFGWHWSRPPSLWLLDVLAIPLVALLYWFDLGGGWWM